MLKAYDYSDRPMDNKMHESGLFNKEKKIASKYVFDHPLKNVKCECSICNSDKVKNIFSRWDVNYYLCESCASIFVPVSKEVVEGYSKLQEMKDFRNSEEYQNQASESRDVAWDDVVSWAEYRTYRYLGKNSGLEVLDYGNKYKGFVNKILNSKLISNYELRDSVLDIKLEGKVRNADVLIYMNQLQHEMNPIKKIEEIGKDLKNEGILLMSTRLGSGFDILTLKGGINDVFPYEHITLPSKKGLEIILDRAGYELLEITTPGTRDMNVVLNNKERIEDSNFFIKYLLDVADERTLKDFQQFLQKSCLSSFAQVVARKR